MMPWNEEGYGTEQICPQVPCTDCLRGKERKKQAEKHQSTYITKRKEMKGTYA